VGDYSVSAQVIEAAADGAADPWAALEAQASALSDAHPAAPVPSARDVQTAPVVEDDPFGDWDFEASSSARAAGSVVQGADIGALAAFFRGLGLDPASVGPLAPGEVEDLGRLVRMLIMGMLQLHESGATAKEEMHAEDRTMVARNDNNPLKSDWPEATKLRYLFGGRASSIGFPKPERALAELLLELLAHSGASAAATRAALESTVKEFAPEALKARFQVGGPKLLEGARAWDAYRKYYEREGGDVARWAQRLLDRYYSDAYLRESARIKRETPPRQR
jgi:type VI secretion system FHA domain protein